MGRLPDRLSFEPPRAATSSRLWWWQAAAAAGSAVRHAAACKHTVHGSSGTAAHCRSSSRGTQVCIAWGSQMPQLFWVCIIADHPPTPPSLPPLAPSPAPSGQRPYEFHNGLTIRCACHACMPSCPCMPCHATPPAPSPNPLSTLALPPEARGPEDDGRHGEELVVDEAEVEGVDGHHEDDVPGGGGGGQASKQVGRGGGGRGRGRGQGVQGFGAARGRVDGQAEQSGAHDDDNHPPTDRLARPQAHTLSPALPQPAARAPAAQEHGGPCP